MTDRAERVGAIAINEGRTLVDRFGASTDETDVGRVVDIADGNQLSWIEWAYCGCDDPTGSRPSSNEALVYDPRLPATGKNVDAATLSTLVEPYPRIVAGTPITYGYDAAIHRFHLTYSTKAPDGKRFGRLLHDSRGSAPQVPLWLRARSVSGGKVVPPPTLVHFKSCQSQGVSRSRYVIAQERRATRTIPWVRCHVRSVERASSDQ